MSTSTDNEGGQSQQQQQQQQPNLAKSRFVNLIRQYSLQVSNTMRGLKLKDRSKITQVHAFNPSDTSTGTTTTSSAATTTKVAHQGQAGYPTISSVLSNSVDPISVTPAEVLLPYGLPATDSLQPPIDPFLKSIDFVESLAELYRRVEKGSYFDKSLIYLEQYCLLSGLGDPKLLRRCLQSARQHAVDVHSKVVLSAWLRYERREDELVGTSALDCIGRNLECPKAALAHGYDPNSVFDHCKCFQTANESSEVGISTEEELTISEEDGNVCFCIGDEEVYCSRDEALVLIDYALEERANILVASCLQVLLRELPGYLYNSKVMNVFCSYEGKERLTVVGHASFLLYYFLSEVAMEDNMTSNVTIMLLERLRECATERWQKALALHRLGCVLLDRKEYKDAQSCFEAAAEAGHVYSIAGVARSKFKQGQRFMAYELISSLISTYKPAGWMYQERSLYNLGNKKIADLNDATNLDPTLSFPYKYRAVAKLEENHIEAAISEINRIAGFKVSSDCLELRAWFLIALEDYESAMRDIRALLTLEPNYLMFQGKMRGEHLVELLNQHVQQWSPADCWMQLYDRWSSVDDIGSLAVIQQMLINDPGKSVLRFRQSLLLLRLNCQKAAMRSLRLARNHSGSKYERLVYEGWILYDTGHREEALSKAEESISIQRSFEAFFLKAYALADSTLDPEAASYVVQLLEEALRCPSDGLRKGQALNNLGSIYVDCGKLELAADCYVSALKIKHTRAHQGLARVYHLKNDRRAAYDEMAKLIDKAQNKASAYEKRSEYCDRDLANNDLSMASQFDPLRTYPYRYRAAVLMDDQRENEAVEELTRAIAFKPDLQMLNLRAAFHESMGDFSSALRDCQAALCLDQNHKDTLDLYNRTQTQAIDPRT
ncbi:ethylene-overproduction protein 1-like isoform X2 [Coffea arabica]|uniref:Ethylene-overproduction protein 1-like isoform X2 n=1 Tax=Coffea arabica TaxID=13443 RepID=A0ABM4WVA1_COFAR